MFHAIVRNGEPVLICAMRETAMMFAETGDTVVDASSVCDTAMIAALVGEGADGLCDWTVTMRALTPSNCQ